jgi:hypothetical protein
MKTTSTPLGELTALPDERRVIRPSAEQASRDQLSGEQVSGEHLSAESLSAESLNAEGPLQGPRTEPSRAEAQSCERFATTENEAGPASRLGGLSYRARRLLAGIPSGRDAKSAWLKQLASDEEITIHLVRVLGGDVRGLDQPFACLLHPGCQVALTRGRNGQIVYHDPTLTDFKRQFQTIPELAVTLRTGVPKKLQPLQLALWSLRVLHKAGLVDLPLAAVPQVAAGSPASVQRARDGFEVLIRCRWFLDPGEAVAFSRNFVRAWCGIDPTEVRVAIEALIDHGVIRKVDEARSNFKRPTFLYLPGEGRPS